MESTTFTDPLSDFLSKIKSKSSPETLLLYKTVSPFSQMRKDFSSINKKARRACRSYIQKWYIKKKIQNDEIQNSIPESLNIKNSKENLGLLSEELKIPGDSHQQNYASLSQNTLIDNTDKLSENSEISTQPQSESVELNKNQNDSIGNDEQSMNDQEEIDEFVLEAFKEDDKQTGAKSFIEDNDVFVDESVQMEHYKYNLLSLVRKLRINSNKAEIADINANLAINTEPIQLQLKQCPLPKAKLLPVNSCTLNLNAEQYEYIKDLNDLKSPFHKDISTIPPKGIPAMHITEEERSEVSLETEKPFDAKYPFTFWDPNRISQWNSSLKTSKWGKIFEENVNKIASLADITEWNTTSKMFLTDCCIDTKGLFREQVLITALMLQGISQNQVIKIMGKFYPTKNYSRKRIKTCFHRTLKGLLWCHTEFRKERMNLSFTDSLRLIAEIDIRIAKDEPPQTNEVAQRAEELFILRRERAKLYYNSLSPQKKKAKEMEDFFKSETPQFGKSWVNAFVKRAGFQLREGEYIERARGVSCTAVALLRWCYQFGVLLDIYKNRGELLYNMDETMIQLTNNKRKFVVTRGCRKGRLVKEPKLQHITVACCYNAIGITAPLFIILNNVKKMPEELKNFQSQDVYFAAQSSGWMTNELFLQWTKVFVKHINDMRSINTSYSDEPITLVMDSHPSRANVQALQLLKNNNIRLITFPPHCTHVIGIAHSLKLKFSKNFQTQTKDLFEKDVELGLPEYRFIAVGSIIQSWKEVLTLKNAKASFIYTGLCPFNAGVMLSGRGINFVSTKDPEKELRKTKDKLFITSEELTSDEMITYIATVQSDKHREVKTESWSLMLTPEPNIDQISPPPTPYHRRNI